MWIEVFRTGTHTDSAGRTESYNAEKLDLMAARYNHKVSESESNLAPVVKGHPKDNDPAFGWVERLARRGTKLMAKLKGLTSEFINEVRAGKFRKISIALYNDLMLRHIGFLGALPPAVEGLSPVSFADISGYIEFEHYSSITEEEHHHEEKDPDNPSTETSINNYSDYEHFKNEIGQLKSLNEEYKSKLEIREKEQRLKEFREFANSLIESTNGAIITPSQADKLIDILEMAFQADSRPHESHFKSEQVCDDNKPVSAFNELHSSDSISNVDKVKQFISSFQPVFDCREYAMKNTNALDSGNVRNNNRVNAGSNDVGYSDKVVSPDRMYLHRRAIEIKNSTPGLSYEEAVCMAVREGVN